MALTTRKSRGEQSSAIALTDTGTARTRDTGHE